MSRELCLRNRQRTRAVDLPLLRRITQHLLSHHFSHNQFALAVHLIAAPEMARLNERFLGHAGSTDVITFDWEGGAAEGLGLTQPPLRGNEQQFDSSSVQGRRAQERADTQADAPPLHGEIFICLDEAAGQAQHYRTTWQAELARYLIHGLLHLHGYDDLNPPMRRKMKRVETRLLHEISGLFDLERLAKAARRSNSKSQI